MLLVERYTGKRGDYGEERFGYFTKKLSKLVIRIYNSMYEHNFGTKCSIIVSMATSFL
ncbi:MAG TPA: hypothetical protein PLC00_03025 [Bacteroidales bacterium]|jgi:hypothetical protein|nr:hypothetical protein [Bacteroidales bacterium]HQP90902.1 hypothetical protein [Bacteroidales bacterium]